MSPISKAYRGLLRELVKSSPSPGASRNKIITANIRRAVFGKVHEGGDLTQIFRNIENATSFLHAQRVYEELLERYSPLHDLTEKERIRATARRVGLDTPEQYQT